MHKNKTIMHESDTKIPTLYHEILKQLDTSDLFLLWVIENDHNNNNA